MYEMSASTRFGLLFGFVVSAAACAVSGGSSGGNRADGSGDGAAGDATFTALGHDVAAVEVASRDVMPNADAFFALDPPPRYCGPDGGVGPDVVVPGGTPECPDDKNREGCPCPLARVGQTAPCWPGLRANRNHGICHDGMTTCLPVDDVSGQWGPCMNYQLPQPLSFDARGSCTCFSAGRWAIDNLSPCFVQSAGTYYAVSTFIDASGVARCPTSIMSVPPAPQPGTVWSPNALTVDCAGQFHLCYTLKAGNAMNPAATDCTVVEVCTDAWYGTPNAMQTFPPLPSWTSTNSACATAFATTGGYGEMSVLGTSVECDSVSSGGQRYVFNRVQYCPLSCNSANPPPECAMCSMNGSGGF